MRTINIMEHLEQNITAIDEQSWHNNETQFNNNETNNINGNHDIHSGKLPVGVQYMKLSIKIY